MSKRPRSSNFSQHEVLILTELISANSIIENKIKSRSVEQQKKEAWEKIVHSFNCREHVFQRDIKQLKVSSIILLINVLVRYIFVYLSIVTVQLLQLYR